MRHVPLPDRRRCIPVLLLGGLFLAAAVPLIAAGLSVGRPAGDMVNYHEPAIRTFARQWPTPDLHDYISTTTPGYHLALALVARYLNDSTAALQLAGAFLSLGFIATLGLALARLTEPAPIPGRTARCTRPFLAAAAGLPVVASIYVYFPGVWLLPDNAAWWGVLAVLVLAMLPGWSTPRALAAGGILVLLVGVRQIHIWAACLMWTAAWLAAAPAAGGILRPVAPRLAPAALAIAASLPGFALLGYFILIWGGLTPPTFQPPRFPYEGLGLSAPAFFFSLLGLFGLAYAGFWGPAVLRSLRSWPWHVAAAAAAGLVAAAAPATTPDEPVRSSGLWKLAEKLPVLGGHSSPIFLILTPLGAVVLLGISRALPRHERWVLLAAVAGFLAAQIGSPFVWQRYHEPMVLLILALAACRIVSAEVEARDLASLPTTPAVATPLESILIRARFAGPLALGLALAALSALVISTATPPDRIDVRPYATEHPWGRQTP